MYAIINDRGHQYKVREGDLLRVDLLTVKTGSQVTFDEVLLVGKDAGIQVGTPRVAGARVTGTVENEAKGEKLIAMRRIRTNKKVVRQGHRTQYSMVRIEKIEG
jgi:large subunit ribosomal protein L21